MELLHTVLQWLQANGTDLVGALLTIVGGFAVIARFTPNTTDDRIVQVILDLINFLGMNHGKAKNDPAKP